MTHFFSIFDCVPHDMLIADSDQGQLRNGIIPWRLLCAFLILMAGDRPTRDWARRDESGIVMFKLAKGSIAG